MQKAKLPPAFCHFFLLEFPVHLDFLVFNSIDLIHTINYTAEHNAVNSPLLITASPEWEGKEQQHRC